MLRRASQAAESGKGDDKPPFMIRGRVDDVGNRFAVDVELPFLVRLSARLHVCEWVLRDDLVPHRQLEELPRPFDRAPRRRRGVLLILHVYLSRLAVFPLSGSQETLACACRKAP